MDTSLKLILASGSPRRKSLLEEAGYSFDVVVSDAEESTAQDCTPEQLAQRNASVKAIAVAEQLNDDGALVVGADTIVVHEGKVYGKPASEDEARATLETLSGKTHQVITGVCLVCGAAYLSFAETTDVRFKQLDSETIAAYIATGESMDKAGSYGIQGKGSALVEEISGDYDNVVGLPVSRLAEKLDLLGIERKA